MSTIKQFTDLEVWRCSRANSKKIWSLISNKSFSADFALRNQVSRSSGSVMDNIAEGFGRGGNKEFIQFLGFARGSNTEFQSQIYRALDRSHITQNDFDLLKQDLIELNIKLSNLMNYLRKSSYRGSKFK